MVQNRFYNDIPYGCSAFGSGTNQSIVDRWIEIWSKGLKDFSFILILANTKTAEIKGVSAAGATAKSRRYTAISDAELLLNGPSCKMQWPLPPLPAGVSPALISHVASRLLNATPQIITAGLLQRPTFPHLEVEPSCEGPANCLSTGEAMSIERVERLWQKGISIGKSLKKPLLLAESVPGGTTTAHAILEGLGLSVSNFVSGSVRYPPLELKKSIVNLGLQAAKLGTDPMPKKVLAAVGDPFQAVSAGILIGARHSDQPVLLGGGSQMLAVIALALSEITLEARSSFMDGISIGTTSWLASESLPSLSSESSFVNLMNIVSDYFGVSILGLANGLRFNDSSKQALRDYEDGYVKEGVGAGALTLLAQLDGCSQSQLIEACELAVESLQNTQGSR